MPKLAEYCEVRTTSGIYRDWLSVVVSYTTGEHDTPRKFRLVAAEPSTKLFRLKPGDRVDLALAGRIVINGGYIVDRQAAFDATRHGVQLDGYSRAGPMTQVSVNVPGGQFRNYDISAIANRVLEPVGVKFRVQNPPDGAMLPFPNVNVRTGETPGALIARLARQRGLRLSSDADGTVVAGPKSGGSSIELVEGRNILSGTCRITMPSAATLIGQAQKQGSDGLFGRQVAEIQSHAGIQNGPAGTVIKMTAEMPLSQQELQTRVNMTLADLQASWLQVNVVHQGWLKPGGSELWELGDYVKVRSPMLFPTAEGEMTLRVWSVTYTQDAQGGTTTGLELVNEAGYAVKNPNGQDPAPFWNQPTTPPQADQPT